MLLIRSAGLTSWKERPAGFDALVEYGSKDHADERKHRFKFKSARLRGLNLYGRTIFFRFCSNFEGRLPLTCKRLEQRDFSRSLQRLPYQNTSPKGQKSTHIWTRKRLLPQRTGMG